MPQKLGTPGTSCLSIYLKEVKTKNNYGYGTMFGVPFVLQVPREGMDYDKLYQMIVARLKRCLRPAAKVDDAVSNSPSNSVAAADNDMDTDDADLSADIENGNVSRSTETNGMEHSPSEGDDRTLFTMDLVNLGGNTSFGKVKSNGKPIVLAGTSYSITLVHIRFFFLNVLLFS